MSDSYISKVKRILISTSLTNIVVIFLMKPSSEMKFLLLSEDSWWFWGASHWWSRASCSTEWKSLCRRASLRSGATREIGKPRQNSWEQGPYRDHLDRELGTPLWISHRACGQSPLSWATGQLMRLFLSGTASHSDSKSTCGYPNFIFQPPLSAMSVLGRNEHK